MDERLRPEIPGKRRIRQHVEAVRNTEQRPRIGELVLSGILRDPRRQERSQSRDNGNHAEAPAEP